MLVVVGGHRLVPLPVHMDIGHVLYVHVCAYPYFHGRYIHRCAKININGHVTSSTEDKNI